MAEGEKRLARIFIPYHQRTLFFCVCSHLFLNYHVFHLTLQTMGSIVVRHEKWAHDYVRW